MSLAGIQFLVAFTGTAVVAVFLARRSRLPLVVAAVLGTVVAVWQLESHQVRPPAEEDVTNRPIEVREKQYVSSNTCAACHPQHYDSWYDSYHRTMTQVATPSTVIGKFDGEPLTFRGEKYRFTSDGGNFFIERQVLDHELQRLVTDKRQIVMTTGSHTMQAYWAPGREGRELNLAPFVYLREEDRWIPESSSFLRPPQNVHAPRQVWNSYCQSCHATGVQPMLDSMDTKVGELGIACEACHGPAEQHVALNQDPRRRYRSHRSDTRDPSIVNPARLSAQRASEVCGQCHGISHPSTEAEHLASTQEGLSYRPGDVLADTATTYHAGNLHDEALEKLLETNDRFFVDRYWSDGMVRVSGREYSGLLDTPCFNHGDPTKKALSCLDCHTMHQPPDDPRPRMEWANDQLTLGMDNNEACLQCHEELRGDLEKHTHHRNGSTGSLCYNCHMPYTTFGLLKAIRSHTVDAPSVAVSIATGRPNACNQCHLDKTLAWTAKHLDDWYSIPKPELSADERSVAASILWALKGDAGQRALMAWNFGWDAAHQASQSDWIIPYVTLLLVDPYDAVRYIAYRSLRSLPGCSEVEYDFVGPHLQMRAGYDDARRIWARRGSRRTTGSEILIEANGTLRQDVIKRLLSERNNRPMTLQE